MLAESPSQVRLTSQRFSFPAIDCRSTRPHKNVVMAVDVDVVTHRGMRKTSLDTASKSITAGIHDDR